jgi:predicted lipoprotein with Yx(FWY)xxD motif/plastocyanin
MNEQLSRRWTRVGIPFFGLVILAIALAGCAGPASTGQSGGAAPAATATTAPVATEAPAPTEAPTAAPTVAPTEAAAAAPEVTGPATVMIATDAKLGDILVDEKGMTLYLFTKDTPNTSNCYDKCATAWPPLLTKGDAVAGMGADKDLLGTTTRKDGTNQVTYNGWPLYYYVKDQKPGDVTGQDVGGVWYVLSPKGEEVETPGAEATPEATATTAASGAAPAAQPSGPATVMIAKDPKFGDFLVDEKGMALYLFTKDTPDTSNCYDKCAAAWPPLLTKGDAVAGTGADKSLFGTTTRKDGTTQVTYNHWPLYYYVKDQKPGDVTGQDVGKVWFLLTPKGEMIQGAGAAAPAATAAPASEGKTVNASIKGFSFGQPLTVSVGTTVIWTNEDDAAHTVTANDGSFDSGDIAKGETFSFKFEKAGTFDYTCTIHPNMKGQVIVTQ